MAQTGYTPILIYASNSTGISPSASNLTNSASGAELAINYYDGKLFYKDNAGAVQVLAWKTTPTTAGGTGLTSWTAGQIPYYASGSTLSQLNIGTSGYVLTSTGTAPTWSAPSAVTIGTATNLAGGATGSVPYQTSAGATSFLSLGTTNYVLTAGASAPQYVAQSTLSVGTATNVAGGTTGALHYQTGAGATSFLSLGTTNYVLTAGASAPQYVAQSTLSVGSATTATNIAGGAAGSVPYQTSSGTTTFRSIGTANYVMTSSGTAPQWVAQSTITSGSATNLSGGSTGSVVYQSAAGTSAYLSLGTTNYVLTAGASAPQYVAQSTLSVGSATTATTATNVAGGAAGSLVYQTGSATTSTLALGTTNYVLTAGASAPQYVAQSTLSVGSATTATTATNVAGGAAGSLVYQTGSGATSTLGLGTANYVLTAGVSAPQYVAQSTLSVGSATTATTATNVTGGAAGSLVYQTGSGATSTLALGTTNYVLTAGASAPQYVAQSSLSVGSATTATTATTATNLASGAANQIAYQTGSGATAFITAPVSSSTYLGWNGSSFAWSTVSVSPGGSTTQLQYNNAGAFGGMSGVTWDNTFSVLSLASGVALQVLGNAGKFTASSAILVNGTYIGTGDGSSSARNTGVGTNTNFANISQYCTSVGYAAGQTFSNAYYNTVVGASAGTALSSGSSNTAIGFEALTTAAARSDNTAVGSGALRNFNGTGKGTAVGSSAAYTSNGGGKVDAFGYQSMYGNTSGDSNCSFGYQSLYTNTISNSNSAFGTYTLKNQDPIAAGSNSAFGAWAGFNVTTGLGNTYLGAFAARSSVNGVDSTTGSYNVLIGYYSTVAATGDSSCIVIGTTTTNGTAGKGSSTGFINPNGGGVYQGNNSSSWSTTSDERIKTNFKAVENGLDIINALEPTEFDYIVTGKHDVGFRAQQYMTVLPDQVSKHSASKAEAEIVGEDEIYGINRNLDPYFVSAIKSLTQQVEELKAELAALKK